MGNNLSNTKNMNNQLIQNIRKRKRIKRAILLIVFLVSIGVTLCLKLPYFNIKNIEVKNNRNIPMQEIINLSGLKLDKNIFYLNLKKSRTNILTNSYILNASIKRKLPNKLEIHVDERTAIFYIKKNDKFLIVDSSGIILEEKSSVDNMKLIKLDGFDKYNYELGGKIQSDEEKIILIGEITKLIKNLKEGVPEPVIVDLLDTTDIKLFYGDMVIKLGTSFELAEKYNKGLNILVQNKLIGKKGYIDVSFKGDSVFLVNN